MERCSENLSPLLREISATVSDIRRLHDFLWHSETLMQKSSKFLKNSVIQMGPFVKVQINVESWSQSSTPLPPGL